MTEALLQELRRYAEDGEVLSPQARRRINTAATLPDEFLEAVARTMEDVPHFGDVARLSTAEIHDTVASTNEEGAVAEELERVLKTMRDRIAARRADIGQRALLVYALAKRSDDEQVIVHAERMRLRLRPRGRR